MSLVVPFDEIFNDEGLLSKHSSWKHVELGSVCRVVNGFAFPSKNFNRDKVLQKRMLSLLTSIAPNSTAVMVDALIGKRQGHKVWLLGSWNLTREYTNSS